MVFLFKVKVSILVSYIYLVSVYVHVCVCVCAHVHVHVTRHTQKSEDSLPASFLFFHHMGARGKFTSFSYLTIKKTPVIKSAMYSFSDLDLAVLLPHNLFSNFSRMHIDTFPVLTS